MEPITATTTAALSVYQAGGLVLVLIIAGIIGVSLLAKWFMGMVRDLGKKLDEVRGEMQVILVSCISQNTVSNNNLQTEVAKQTRIIEQQTECMRSRRCLIDDDETRSRANPHLPQSRAVR